MSVPMARIRCAWSGWSGQPGVSTFFADPTLAGFADALHQFFEGIKGQLPSSVTVTVPNQGDEIDSATGALVGQWTDGTGGSTTGTAGGARMDAQGVQIRWSTTTIHNGRHLRGRTFLVPFPASYIDTNGLLQAASVTTLQQACNALVGGTAHTFYVWGRPKAGAGGVAGSISTGTPMTKAVVLRSRRD